VTDPTSDPTSDAAFDAALAAASDVGDAGDLTRVDVVVVAYGPEPWLPRCIEAILASTGVRADVVLVDNGGTEGLVDDLESLEGVTVLRPGRNTGFGEGCNLGVAAATAPFVALINHDAVVEPGALAALVHVAARPEVGLATASVRLADQLGHLNSAGNDIHFLGLSWSGCFDEPATDYPDERVVTGASGAALACRIEVWQALGGFDDEFFAYHEDADLSLRSWEHGWSNVYVPTAVVEHRYEFSRNALKYELIERNRLIMVLTAFGPRQLVLTAPALLALEVVMLAFGAKEGWLGAKLRGYGWLVRHASWLRGRRRRVQGERTISEAALADLLVGRMQAGNFDAPDWFSPFDRVLAGYWTLVKRLL
jgi:GT2 family glycosyltransferase